MLPPAKDWNGNWFHRLGWRVFPKARALEVSALVKAGKDEYHHQVDWSLAKFEAHNAEESRLISAEFLRAASEASEDLPLLIDVTLKDRRKHGWKHVTYRDVEVVAKKALNPPAAAMRLERLPLPQITKLFSEAVRRDPRAVAHLTKVFPDDDERQRVARYYLSGDPSSEVGILSAPQLAADCVKAIYRDRTGQVGQEARRAVEILISKKAAAGLDVKAGKPGTFLHGGYVKEAHRVGQALFKQFCQVTDLLERFDRSEESLRDSVAGLYPFIDELQEGAEAMPLLTFRGMSARDAAFAILETLLPQRSTLENAMYSRRR